MRALAILIALAGCKDKTEQPAASSSPTGSAAPAAATGELATLLPKVEGAKVLAKRAPNEAYALETWCIDEADAAPRITAALEREGWTAIKTRGEPARDGETQVKQAVSAMKGDIRFSGRIGGADSRCAGTSVTATVMRLGNLDDKLRESSKVR